ncbi:MAG: glutathione S-transferase [Anaerolineae bacterium]|nr:glutathione S-transferase [Gloeobacterales cyanobacterium ES-bin-313]
MVAQTVYPLPSADDTPEEVLRLEDPGYGNSMINGDKLNLGEYARLSAELQDSIEPAPKISQKLKDLIFLLKIRKLLRTFLPFF